MLDRAPRRPALLPALLFLAAAWAAPPPLLLAALLPVLAWAVRLALLRRLDAALLLGAIALGMFAAWEAPARRVETLAGAALSLPIGVPFERSWVGTLHHRPQRIDRHGWLVVVDARTERGPRLRLRLEIPSPGADERQRLSGMSAGQRVRFWARVRIDPLSEPSPIGAFATGTIKSSRLLEGLDERANSARHALPRARDGLHDRLSRLYGREEEELAFLSAVLLGRRTARPATLEERLRASGLAHLLAISGLHVGLVGRSLSAATRRVSGRSWCRVVGTGGMLVVFGSLVGASVPVLRAVTGMLVLLIGEAVGREGDPLNRLACLAVALGLCLPTALSTPAFALSFAATGGILVALEREGDLAPVRMSCAAYLATAPFSALYFGQLAPWAIVANLLAVPLLMLLLATGYASLLFADVPWVSDAAVALTRAGYAGIETLAARVDALPGSPVFVARIDSLGCAATASLAIAGWLAPSRRCHRPSRALFALALVWIHVGPPPAAPRAPVAVLMDVGQGQALLWHDVRGTTLIDAGGRGFGRWDPGAGVVRPALVDRGTRRLDRLVLSHGDADHAAGAFALIEGLEIGELWLGPGWWTDGRLVEIAAGARRRGAAVRLVASGDSARGVRILGPQRMDRKTTGNARSVVALLGDDPWTLFVPGDLDGEPLGRFLDDVSIPRARAVVLAHHGSRSGTPDALLDRLRPRVALVSCGLRNRFGHPHPQIVRRLDARRVPLRRTDHHGTIRLEGRPGGWRVETER